MSKKGQMREELEKAKLKKEELARILQFRISFSQIDLTKHPKPWLFNNDKLLDSNNQEIAQAPESKEKQISTPIKPVFTTENKIYIPFWNGQVSIIDTQSGKVDWQDLPMKKKT